MTAVERHLEAEGYLVWNKTYPSREAPIEALSPALSEGLFFCTEKNKNQVYVVTHSMGGILTRHFLQTRKAPEIKGIVMLAPPNHGSEIVDEYMNEAVFQTTMGPASVQLTTHSHGFLRTLKPISVPVGIIAGTLNKEPWFAHLFKGPNDGKVSVESAKLEEMTDFMTIEEGHTFIMNSPRVLEAISRFFQKGSFSEAGSNPPKDRP